jgi:hypothetical protein
MLRWNNMKNGILIAVLLLVLTPTVFACVCPDYLVSFNNVTTIPTNGKYNWSYIVCRNYAPGYTGGNPINYIMIQTCICTNKSINDCISSFGSNAGTGVQLSYTNDSTTGITGLKFYNLPSFSGCKNFWFVTNDNYNQINTTGGIKVSDYYLTCNYTVKGPQHIPIPAPEFPSIAVPLIISLGAASFIATRKTS